MSLTTITGPLLTPVISGTEVAYVSFKLSSWDYVVNGRTSVSGPFVAQVDPSGQFNIDILNNTEGENSTTYTISVIYQKTNGQYWEEVLGTAVVPTGGPYSLADLAITSTGNSTPTDILAQVIYYSELAQQAGANEQTHHYPSREAFKTAVDNGDLDSLANNSLVVAGDMTFVKDTSGHTFIADLPNFRSANTKEVHLRYHKGNLQSWLNEALLITEELGLPVPDFHLDTAYLSVCDNTLDFTPFNTYLVDDTLNLYGNSYTFSYLDAAPFSTSRTLMKFYATKVNIQGPLFTSSNEGMASPTLIHLEDCRGVVNNVAMHRAQNAAVVATGCKDLVINNPDCQSLPVSSHALSAGSTEVVGTTAQLCEHYPLDAVVTSTGLVTPAAGTRLATSDIFTPMIGSILTVENMEKGPGTTVHSPIASVGAGGFTAQLTNNKLNPDSTQLIRFPLVTGSITSGTNTIQLNTCDYLPAEIVGRTILIGDTMRKVTAVDTTNKILTLDFNSDVTYTDTEVETMHNILLENCSNVDINYPFFSRIYGNGITLIDCSNVSISNINHESAIVTDALIRLAGYSTNISINTLNNDFSAAYQRGLIHVTGVPSNVVTHGINLNNVHTYSSIISGSIHPTDTTQYLDLNLGYVGTFPRKGIRDFFIFEPENYTFIRHSIKHYDYSFEDGEYISIEGQHYPPILITPSSGVGYLRYPYQQGDMVIRDYTQPAGSEIYVSANILADIHNTGITPKVLHIDNKSTSNVITSTTTDLIENATAPSNAGYLSILFAADGILLQNQTTSDFSLSCTFIAPPFRLPTSFPNQGAT